jgi:cytochrome c-type biogenesis protein CcmH
MRVPVAMLALLACIAASAATFEPRGFASPEHERSYRKLTNELRCLVCQNQNIADSDADLATDLRREVYERLESGASEREVLDFMVERFGDFVLYRPPLRPATVALWVGPFVLAALGLAVLARRIRSRARASRAGGEPLDEAARRRLSRITGEEDAPREG